MSNSFERAHEIAGRRQWAHVSSAWCDYPVVRNTSRDLPPSPRMDRAARGRLALGVALAVALLAGSLSVLA